MTPAEFPWSNSDAEISEPYRQMHRLIKESSAASSAQWDRLNLLLWPLLQIASWDFGGQRPTPDEGAMVDVAYGALCELALDLGIEMPS